MKIDVSNQALEWFKDEMGVSDQSQVRFFVRYGGCSSVQSNFSLGVDVTIPKDPVAETTRDNILFFVEQTDEWFFDSHDLEVKFDESTDELAFTFPEPA
ncbi:HesB/YadR/YfhF family protein [Aureibacillus halotolerans]|uniref:Uncharacterized protein YneR n=1 Tax=Aureibacillus halotolerans TaxID=1508390 RepID=A0A4R6U5J7_9BACI|nr:HesB/YadR/YfhF family protein [Aureibacillus halotolerans]TDQ39755.1 uncharacterized protein YneR [Aureibacillus halotolerans]